MRRHLLVTLCREILWQCKISAEKLLRRNHASVPFLWFMNKYMRTVSTESRGTRCQGVCGCDYWSKLQTIGDLNHISVHVTQTWRPKMETKHSKYKGRNRLHEWAIRKTNFVEIGDKVTKLTPTQTSPVLSSVTQSCPTLCDPHGPQHTRPPYPLPTPWVYSNSCPLSQWCHPTSSSFVVPFSSHLQSFPASGYFQMSQFFASGGRSIGVSVSTTVLPMNIQDWSPLGRTGWISLQSKRLSRISNTTVQNDQFFGTQLSL